MIDSLKRLVNKAIEASESRNLRDIEKERKIDNAISNCYNEIKKQQIREEENLISQVKTQVWVASVSVLFPIGMFVGYYFGYTYGN